MHTVKTHKFATRMEAVNFRGDVLAGALPHEDVYVGLPTHMTAEFLWPSAQYPGPIYDDIRAEYEDHWSVRVERFS